MKNCSKTIPKYNSGLKKIVLTMKLTFIMTLVCLMYSNAASYSQNTKFSLNVSQKSVREVLSELEEGSDFRFFYSDDLQKLDEKISLIKSNSSVTEILEDVLKDSNLSYKVLEGNLIIIAPKTNLQETVVSGRVVDKSGDPLPGVNVIEKGTTTGTVTNMEGTYKLEVSSPDAVLVFSYIGFLSEEVEVGGKTTVDVTLVEDITELDEIVVIGYGAVKKSDLTGSVSSVETEEIAKSNIQSIDQGLAGKASGVVVTQTSGAPGAIASIRIRGASSLEGGNEPLYVIDGFPIYGGSGIESSENSSDNISALSTLNPNDIESIEILKDASATAIYGARAANGVVLITTKTGKRGEDRISFDASYGFQSVVQKIDVMNAYQYATLVNEAYENDGYGANYIYSAAKMSELQANPEGTDWQDEIFRSAPTRNYQLTFSGGDEKNLYAISAGYFDQDGIIINSNFKRYSGRINLDRRITDNFKVGTHTSISHIINDAVETAVGGQGGVISGALKFNPVLPVYANEEETEYTLVNAPGLLIPNPVATAKEQVNKTGVTRLLSDVYAEQKFLRYFTAKVSFGVDLLNSKYNNYIPSNIYQSGGDAVATIAANNGLTWLNENTISFLKDFGKHSISSVAGVTFQENHTEMFSASSEIFTNDILEENSLESGSIYNQPTSSTTEWNILSYLGRVNYSFDNKYLFSVSGRIDGSSRFGANNKYAFFPSGSFAWRASEEPFLKNIDVISMLKFRVAYGYTGNQEIGLYNSLSTLASNTYYIGGAIVTGFAPDIIPNPDLRWEKTGQFDLGVDFNLFNNRLRITADYYNKKTTDILYSTAVPYVSGFSVSLQNIGSIRNQGIELSIGANIITAQDFSWETNFNYAMNRSEVLELGGEEYKDVGTGDDALKTGSIHRLIVGEALGLFYGYVDDGIFQNEAEVAAGPEGTTNWVGGRRYKDLSGAEGVPDGAIDASYDRQIIGDPNPDFTGGMTNTFRYKDLSLLVFAQWSYGGDLFNYNSVDSKLASGGQNVYAELTDRWSESNPDAKYTIATTNRSNQFSSFFIEDGSYLKIKTITLTYNVSKLKGKYIKNFEVYSSLNNFITFTNYSGYDPEVSYRGASNLEIGEDFGGYPQAKTIMFGVRISL